MKQETKHYLPLIAFIVFFSILVSWAFYFQSDYRGKELFKVGDCITSDWWLEEHAQEAEEWEERKPLKYSIVLKKGLRNYRVQDRYSPGTYIANLEYGTSFLYQKIECPKEDK